MEINNEEMAILSATFNQWKTKTIRQEDRIRHTNSDILLVDGL
jgi:hypothetical protein